MKGFNQMMGLPFNICRFGVLSFIVFLISFISSPALAAFSTTWTGASGIIWSNSGNWSPATVPGTSPSPFDTAIFSGTAVNTTAANTGTITLDTLQYNAGATTYVISNSGAGNFTLAGTGIVNNSSNTQQIVNSGILTFTNSASAGSNIQITNNSGTINFQGSSTGTNASILNNGTGVIDISGLTASSTSIGGLAGTGSVILGSKELQIGAINASGLISGTISGVGGQLTKTGTGTLTLSGTNTYTGVTTISGGTLQIGNGGTTGSVSGDIVDNASLSFSRSDSFTYGGDISGTGTIGKFGLGTLTLTGNTTTTGLTTVSVGSVQIGNGGTTGSISGNISLASGTTSLTFNRSDDTSYGGNISGGGSITKNNTNTLTLTGSTTTSGTTTISGGTLQVGNGGTTGSISGNITDNANLAFDRSNSLTYAGVISGTGSVNQIGTGTTILTGANTYSGGTTISAGTLQIGNGVTGNVSGDIVDNSNLIFNRSTLLVYAGIISGSGTVTKQGIGTLTLTGDSTYAGTTTISAGSLRLGNGGTSGSITGNIVDNANLTFNRSDNTSYGGVISGNGTVTKQGAGTLTLTGNKTGTGVTTISAGTLQIGNGGTSGSIAGNIVDNANLAFNRSDTLTYGGVISGTGALNQAGSGTTILTNTNTYSGGTTISAGTLQIGNGGATGSISGNVLDNGNLAFNRSDAVTYAGTISGSGAITQLGAGTLTLTADNTNTGTTTISAGTLQLGAGGTSGSIAGNIVDNANLAFNRSDTLTYGGVISGTGALNQAGSGTTILTGANTYSGGTTISAGTLQIGNGGSTGSITGNIVDNGNLVFDLGNAFIYDSVISGTGTVMQSGTNDLVLNGVNTYTGDTSINSGKLMLGDATHTTASVAGDVLINPNGTLSGYGTVGGDVINNGTLSPGASIGTLTINGNYTQSATGDTIIELNANGTSDIVNIHGTASLDGTISVNATEGGFANYYTYTFLTADGGVSGQYSNVDEEGIFTQNFLAGQVVYLPNAVQFTLGFNPIAFAGAEQTHNQRAVGNYLVATGGTQGIQQLIAGLTTDEQFQHALDQISGATYANQTMEVGYIGRWFENTMADRFDSFTDCDNDLTRKRMHKSKDYENCSGYKTPWVAAVTSNEALAPGDVSNLKTNQNAIALGFDVPVGEQLRAGFALGHSHYQSNATINEVAEVDGNLNQAGLYGRYQRGSWLLGAAADFGITSGVDATRQIQGATGPVETFGKEEAVLFAEQIKLGYEMGIADVAIVRPFVGFINQNVISDSFTEDGDTSFALNVNPNSYHSARSQLGAVFATTIIPMFYPYTKLSWEHEFADQNASFDASLIGLPGSFNIIGTEVGREIGVIDAGLAFVTGQWWDISIAYQGQFAQNWQENSGVLKLKVHLS